MFGMECTAMRIAIWLLSFQVGKGNAPVDQIKFFSGRAGWNADIAQNVEAFTLSCTNATAAWSH